MLTKLKQLIQKAKAFVITGKEKAVAVGVFSGVQTYMLENHLHLGDLWDKKTLVALVVAVIGHQIAYWTTNSGSAE